MSKRKRILIIVVLAVLLLGVAAFQWPAPARTVTIRIDAPPGTKLTGSYEVDGVKSPIDAEGPMQFAATGRSVTYMVQEDDRPGEMKGRIAVEGEGYASSATAAAGGGVSGGFKSGKGLGKSMSFWATNSQPGP